LDTRINDPSTEISVLQAALLWFGKDPDENLSYGPFSWIIQLTRDQEVRDIAYEILRAIDREQLVAVRLSWLPNIPDHWKATLGPTPGNLDPNGTIVTVGALVGFVEGRAKVPLFLSRMLPSPSTHSGGAGRPSAMHLIDQELRRLAKKGKLADTRNEQAQDLLDWLKSAHPNLSHPTKKTIANHLSADGLFLTLKGVSPK
jgi:hypothetical protein